MLVKNVAMKFEEINKSKLNNKRDDMSWFPCPQGYNRLMVVIGIIIAIIVAWRKECDDEDEIISIRVRSFFITILLEILLYTAIVWIYHGFKNDEK